MGSFSIWHWMILLIIVGVIFAIIKAVGGGGPRPGEEANTWKLRTFVYVVLALILPLWLVTLPLFLWLAYRSYREGSPPVPVPITPAGPPPVPDFVRTASKGTMVQQLADLEALRNRGALTEEEFASAKRKLLEDGS